MTKKVRFNLYLEPELAKNLSDKAQELAMTKTSMVTLAVVFGYQAIKMATDPQLKDYFEKQVSNDKKAS